MFPPELTAHLRRTGTFHKVCLWPYYVLERALKCSGC